MAFYLKRVVVECSVQGLLSDVRETISKEKTCSHDENLGQGLLESQKDGARLDKDKLEKDGADKDSADKDKAEKDRAASQREDEGESAGDWMVCRNYLESWENELVQNGLEVILLRGLGEKRHCLAKASINTKTYYLDKAMLGENARFKVETQDKVHDNILEEIRDNDRESETLYVTDSSRKAREHLQQGEPVMALLTAENQGEGFVGVKYLSMHLTEISADYLDKVYRRYAGIPWDILETERCFLRETTESDVDAFYEIYADPSITAYMENLYPDREQELAYTRDYIKNVYELYGHGVWTVCLKETGQVIGRAGLSFREGFEDAELGFVIGVTWQGRGIATEVCRAVLEFGARDWGLGIGDWGSYFETSAEKAWIRGKGRSGAGREDACFI